MERFAVRTNIVLGDGLDEFTGNMNKVFVVTDHFMAVSGKVKYVTDRLDRAGKEYEVYSEVAAEPDLGVVTGGVEKLVAFVPDTVICLGGGASIDAAKAIVFIARRIDEKFRKICFIAIPTTSGTGSEVSNFAVIMDKSTETKYPLIDASLLPDIAILDAQLVVSAPPSVTADTGVDVFTHAVEAFVSKEHNDFSDAMAEKALTLVGENLLTVYRDPQNLEARQKMHHASCMAGIAFANSGLGLNHGMAHALGAHFHIPHGRANGILLPYVMSFNAGCMDQLTPAAKRYALISRCLHVEDTNVRQSALTLIRMGKRYIERMNMPSTIAAAGVSEEDFEKHLDDMAAAALADRCTASNPREVSLEQIKDIYRRAYRGKLL